MLITMNLVVLKVAPYTLVQIYIDQCRIFADRQMF